MQIRIMVSRHSAFYSPLISSIAAGFLEQEDLHASYSVLGKGDRSQVDIMQSAVSSNWKRMERGEANLPVHFAQINQRDGFFLAGRHEDSGFEWRRLEGKTLLADHGLQPLVMLRYAANHNRVDWGKIQVIDAGTPEEMDAAFRAGKGDYVHLQAPAPQQLEHDGTGHTVMSVGASMPPVAFSSLCASRDFVETAAFPAFLRAYAKSRDWVRNAPPTEIAAKEASFFPGIEAQSLTAAIARYQSLGCWTGGLEIPRDLYEQALNVFEWAGEISRRYPYDEVCLTPLPHSHAAEGPAYK
jgi:NitT/TauT family transport system substrate-binding protein